MNRRAVLGVAGAACLGATAGCLSTVLGSETQTASVQYKIIFVDVDESEQHVAERPFLRLESRRPGEITGFVAEGHADLVDDGSVSLSEARHNSFDEAYAGIRYAVSFCGGDLDSGDERGCRGTNVSWEDFGRFQFGDEVTVNFDANGTGDAAAAVTAVEAGSTRSWDVEIEPVDFPDEAE